MWGGQFKIQKAQGFATLLFTMVVLASITAFAFISAQSVVNNQRSVMSYHAGQSAFNVAQAGLDYAIPYLDANYETITDGSSQLVTIPGGGRATVQFAFVGDKDTIQVTSTGLTADGTTSSVMKQLVKYQGGSAAKALSQPLTSRSGGFSLSNSFIIGNNSNLTSVKIGAASINSSTASFSNGSRTILNNVTSSSSGSIGPDIILDPGLFSGKTDDQLESEFLGNTIEELTTVTTQTKATVRLVPGVQTSTGAGSDNIVRPLYILNQTAFNSFGGTSSITLSSNKNFNIGVYRQPVVLGTAQNPIVLEVVLTPDPLAPSVKPLVKILANSVIYGDVIIHGGNFHLDVAAKVHGNIIVADGTGAIKQYANGNPNSSGLTFTNVEGAFVANGEINITGGSRIDGLVYTNRNLNMFSTTIPSIIYGGAYSGRRTTMVAGNIAYDANLAKLTSANSTNAGSGSGAYGKVAGSWTDS